MAEKPVEAFLIRPCTSKPWVMGVGRWCIDFLDTLLSLLFDNQVKVLELEAYWFSKQAEEEAAAPKDIEM